MEQPFYTKEQLDKFKVTELRYIKTELEDFVFTITLNRPEKRNAFNQRMAEEIAYVLAFASWDEQVRCVVIKAAGPVFCAGADLNSFTGETIPSATHWPQPLKEVNLGEAFAALNKPSIAQIEGPVLAGGFLILSGVTFAYATPDCYFSLPEVKRGIWPMQVMASLHEIIPKRKLLEMCITGDPVSAEEAIGFGLITHMSRPTSLRDDVGNLAKKICEGAPRAIFKGLEAFRRIAKPDLSVYAEMQKELKDLLHSQDAAEGIRAFNEKRPPQWKNR